jgi:hypothetical protein
MCEATETAIAADGQALATAINAIAAQPNVDPAIAADLKAAATALVAATASWKTGTVLTDVNTAATAIEAILAVIPITAPYATFVAIAVAALDILIGNLGTQTTQGASYIGNARAVLAYVDTLPANHWRGIAVIQHGGNLRQGFIDTWNAAAVQQPQFNFPKL